MPRWTNSLEDNTKEVMDKVIKNLNPELYQKLLDEVVRYNINNNKKIIEQFLRTKLNLTSTLSKNSRRYWILRGWRADEAYVKSKENKQINITSVYSKEYWLGKINPVTGIHYTLEEAEFERNSRRPIRKEYWIKKGQTDAEAVRSAADAKNKNNSKGAAGSKTSDVRRITSKRCIEYFVARGHTQKEATELVSQNQKHFSKEICIEKFGTEEGIKIWQARQSAWQAKLNAKLPEEKARINKLKLSKGITVSKAEKIIANQMLDLGFDVSTQFTLFQGNKKQFVYDIMYNNKIIEYHGDFWHSNPSIYSENYINPRTKILAKDKWQQDQDKLQFAKAQGYEVLVIWESDFKKDKEKVITQCIQFLTQ